MPRSLRFPQAHAGALPDNRNDGRGADVAASIGKIPAAALDALVKKVRALDMHEVRRSLTEQENEQKAPQAAQGGV